VGWQRERGTLSAGVTNGGTGVNHDEARRVTKLSLTIGMRTVMLRRQMRLSQLLLDLRDDRGIAMGPRCETGVFQRWDGDVASGGWMAGDQGSSAAEEGDRHHESIVEGLRQANPENEECRRRQFVS
jgi:hypothetical protein